MRKLVIYQSSDSEVELLNNEEIPPKRNEPHRKGFWSGYVFVKGALVF